MKAIKVWPKLKKENTQPNAFSCFLGKSSFKNIDK